MTVSKYDILFGGRSLALGYVSPHPTDAGLVVASIVPIERSGKWEDGTLEVHFLEAESDLFPKGTPEVEAINQLLAISKIEPSKCKVVKTA